MAGRAGIRPAKASGAARRTEGPENRDRTISILKDRGFALSIICRSKIGGRKAPRRCGLYAPVVPTRLKREGTQKSRSGPQPTLFRPEGLLRNSFCKSLVGLEICFFQSVPKLVLVGGLSCTKACFAPPPPTLSRSHETASASHCWRWKSVSSSRCQNLFWWVGSHAAGATRVSPIRRTGDTPVADGGHEGVLRSPTTHPLALP